MPRRLEVQQIGQIAHAEILFGDLTVLVGPQATGKSILLQLFQLLVDTGRVLGDLKRYGLDWNRSLGNFLDIYFGEGMCGIWRDGESTLVFDSTPVDLAQLVSRQKKSKEQGLFFIPAQRVLTLGKGWPRPFTDYSAGDPFTVRDFSEKLRLLMESEMGRGQAIFPQTRRLKAEIRNLLDTTVFFHFGLGVDKHGAQKRLMLSSPHAVPHAAHSLPFMVWSAGQREFVPLLLGIYWLLPPARASRRGGIEWVVIEEPEMGLHPQAISVVLLLVLELLSRGYRVCLSTHSPHVLDVVWALRTFQQHAADPCKLLELFNVAATPNMKKLAENVMSKEARVYYFDQLSGRSREISELDPGAADATESGWGGLTAFSGHVADVVASVVSTASQ